MSPKLTLSLCAAVFVLAGCAGPFRTGPEHGALDHQLQLRHDGSVLSVQGYVAKTADERAQLLATWERMADTMKTKPGFKAARISPGVGGSPLWLTESEWESLSALRTALSDPTVLARESAMPRRRFGHLFAPGLGGSAQ
jgi:hypothetical protein